MIKYIILIIILISRLSYAGTYYVDDDGAAISWANCEENGGTPGPKSGTAACSIQMCESSANPGDLVYFRSGTYGSGRSTGFTPRSGNAGSGYIVYKNYPGESPVISSATGNNIKIESVGTYSSMTYAEMDSYIEINGFEITDAGLHGIWLHSTHHIKILNNTIHDNTAAGVSAPDGTDHLLIEGNNIYGNSQGGGLCSSGISVWNSGCFFPSGANSYGCKVLDDEAEGFHIIIRKNILHDNHNEPGGCGSSTCTVPDELDVSDGNGVILDNNGDLNPKTLVANNFIYHKAAACRV